MKKMILILSFLSIGLGYTCDNVSPDTKETVVMTDFNFVYGEVKAARKAACEQGKRFVLLPFGYEKHKELGELREVIYRQDNYWKNNKCHLDEKKARCQQIRAKYKEASESLETQKKVLAGGSSNSGRLRSIGNHLVEQGIKKLADEGAKINSIVMSGHDGSGHLYGFAGSLMKTDVVEYLKNSYKGKEELLEDFNSIYLWGCYTTTRTETDWWAKNMPQLNIVAGFHGTGPSIGKAASDNILYDLMSSEKDITNLCDEKDIESALKNLNGLPYLLSGIYTKSCGGEEWYLSRQKQKDEQGNKRYVTEFSPTGTARCEKPENNAENEKNYSRFMEYFNGERDIPTDTANGELRRLYNYARAWYDCADHWDEPAHALDPDQVALLLFYQGVKANFFNSFSGQIEDSLEALDELPMDELDYLGLGRSFFGWLPRKLQYEASKMLQGKDHEALEQFALNYKDRLKNLPKSKEDFVKLSRKELNEYNQMLHELTGSSLALYPGIAEKSQPLFELKKALNIYAYGLDTTCMNMLEWHEDEGENLYENAWRNSCKVD